MPIASDDDDDAIVVEGLSTGTWRARGGTVVEWLRISQRPSAQPPRSGSFKLPKRAFACELQAGDVLLDGAVHVLEIDAQVIVNQDSEECASDRRGRPSQGNGLLEHAVAEQFIEATLRHDLHSATKKHFKLRDETAWKPRARI